MAGADKFAHNSLFDRRKAISDSRGTRFVLPGPHDRTAAGVTEPPTIRGVSYSMRLIGHLGAVASREARL